MTTVSMIYSSHEGSGKKGEKTGSARVMGSGLAGICELAIFHPVDTIIKRLMNSNQKLSSGVVSQVLFLDSANAGIVEKAQTLYRGVASGAMYKISQRVYKFGGQPFLKDFFNQYLFANVHHGGSKTQEFWANGISGAFIGAGEVVLLPFDVLKIKKQTNPDLKKVPMIKIMQDIGLKGLYAGAVTTMVRNFFGSFSLFGVNSLVKESLKGKDKKDTSVFEFILSSTAGSVTSILVACPLDVVKTRLQSGKFDAAKTSMISAVIKIQREEGFGAFFKGSVVKVLTIGPKLIFSFTLAQYLIQLFDK